MNINLKELEKTFNKIKNLLIKLNDLEDRIDENYSMFDYKYKEYILKRCELIHNIKFNNFADVNIDICTDEIAIVDQGIKFYSVYLKDLIKPEEIFNIENTNINLDPEYQEYLRLKEKYENKGFN